LLDTREIDIYFSHFTLKRGQVKEQQITQLASGFLSSAAAIQEIKRVLIEK
jgi:hypothetical protein